MPYIGKKPADIIATAVDTTTGTFSGDIDVDGTTNLDVVDIDGTLNVQGETTLQTHLNMGDGDIIKLGASADLQIYHDGSNSYISEQGTNDLKVLATDFQLKNADDNEFMMTAAVDGAVTLYHNNAIKLTTASTGVNVTGGIGLGGTGAANILDDYEEGTFEVGITATTGTLGIGATTNTLSYTKIGQVVHFRGYINNDTFSGASGDVTITGFPFAVSDLTKFSERPAILISVTGSSDNGAKAGIMTATGTTVIMQNFNASALDTDVDLYFSGSYPTD